MLILQGRKLDHQNPRRSTLGHDFARVGVEVVTRLMLLGDSTSESLERLDRLVDFRNAIVHGNERAVRHIERDGTARATLSSYLEFRRALEGLAVGMDAVVADSLASTLGIDRPW